MLYLIEHKDYRNVPKSAAIISAFFDVHARDIYEFVVKILDDDIVNITEIGEGLINETIYVEINRFDEFVAFSREYFEPHKRGKIKEIVVSDSITDLYQITKNTE